MKWFDPAKLRQAAGLTPKQAADLVHVAQNTWTTWERSGEVTAKRADQVREKMRAAMIRRIEYIQKQIEEIDALG